MEGAHCGPGLIPWRCSWQRLKKTVSPLGQLVTRVITPRLPVEARLVPGPPKRFAQTMGLAFSMSAAVLWIGADSRGLASIPLGMLIGAATLESVFGYCLGCKVFSLLMRLGVIPAEVCDACNNLALRQA